MPPQRHEQQLSKASTARVAVQHSKAALKARVSGSSDCQCPEGCDGPRRIWLSSSITCCSSIIALLLWRRSVQKICWLLLLLRPSPSLSQGPLMLLLTAGHQRGEQPHRQPRQELCILVGRLIIR